MIAHKFLRRVAIDPRFSVLVCFFLAKGSKTGFASRIVFFRFLPKGALLPSRIFLTALRFPGHSPSRPSFLPRPFPSGLALHLAPYVRPSLLALLRIMHSGSNCRGERFFIPTCLKHPHRANAVSPQARSYSPPEFPVSPQYFLLV